MYCQWLLLQWPTRTCTTVLSTIAANGCEQYWNMVVKWLSASLIAIRNNLGLCCFYAQQYDMTLSCFERALALADDENMADVWYNISQVFQRMKQVLISTCHRLPLVLVMLVCPTKLSRLPPRLIPTTQKLSTILECWNWEKITWSNPGSISKHQQVISVDCFLLFCASGLAPHLYQPLLNEAILLFRLGEFQDSFKLVKKVLELYPEHEEAKDLMKQLVALFL